ncbi:hypothetical protein ACMFMF_002823 [Clarireedia jacksonii]
MDQTNTLPEQTSFNEKLPIIEVDQCTQKEDGANVKEAPKKRDGSSLQFFLVIVLIFVNLLLYYVSNSTSASGPRIRPASPDESILRAASNTSSHSSNRDSPPSWLVAIAGAQTDEPFVSFNDLGQFCTSFPHKTSIEECIIDTISSMILYSETLLSLREELLYFATLSTPNKSPHPPNRQWKPLPQDVGVPFQRTAPTSIAYKIDTQIHHVGFHCPGSTSCNTPLFSLSTCTGIPLLFTYPPTPTSPTSQALTFAFGNSTADWSSTTGVDMRFDDVSDLTHPLLDPQTDYPQMRSQLECLLSDNLSTPGIFFSIRHAGTMKSVFRGTASPWIYGVESEIEGMQQVEVPEWRMATSVGSV